MIYPDSGHISVDGKIINKLKFFELEKMRSKISMVFQFGALFDSMSVFENIEMPLEKMSLMNKEERADRIYDVLKEVGMEGTHNKFPDELSGGMKKRVGIARAIAVKPKYILYDEPTTGLDPIMANSINKLISKLHTLESVTSIIVTHEMDTVFNVANRVIMINDGEIRFNGSPDELLSSNDEMVKQFIRVNTHKKVKDMIDDLKNIKLNKTFWNGLFITLMVFLVWWGYNFIRGPKIEEGYSFQVKFDDILSLTKGNDVIYSGLTIGEVKEVGKIGGASSSEITPIVTLSIKKEYEDILYKDAVFTIKSPLFVGDYWVEVSRGIPRSQDKIVKGEVLEGVAELNPSKLPAEIQKGLKPILINFESFSTGLVSLFNPATIEDLKQSITNIRESTLKAKTLTDKFDIEGEGIKLDMASF